MKRTFIIIIGIAFAAVVAIFLGLTVTNNANAYCKESATSTNYCKYSGKIKKVYLNSDNLYLIFLEQAFEKQDAKNFGYNIKSGNALAIQLNGDETSKQFITLANLALTNGLPIEVHSREVLNGYLKVDRMWIEGKSFSSLAMF